jgi:dihydrofolate reductase
MERVEEAEMGRIVVTEYISVDGVVEAPSGTEDFARVGWVDDFRRGPEGDEFKVDETMASDALLLGRVTYDGFAPVWPHVEGARSTSPTSRTPPPGRHLRGRTFPAAGRRGIQPSCRGQSGRAASPSGS